MKYSLRTKLSISYVLVALICVALISFTSNIFLEKQFRKYVTRNLEKENRTTVDLISQEYHNGIWDIQFIENVGVNALEKGMIIKVKEVSGKTIWDATVHNHGLCKQMIDHMSENMSSRYPNFQGKYVENRYPIHKDGGVIGYVEVGYYGPFYFNDDDLNFINTLNELVAAIGLFSLLFAFVLGSVMANRISTPVSRVIHSAQMISRGYFGDRVAEQSNTKEIRELTDTFNELAENLERQEALRKRLTADMAHELRTPIATLQSHLEAMVDGIWEPSAERLKSCHEEIMRISRMIGDLEKLTRYESDTFNLQKSEFDLAEAVQHIVNNFEPEYHSKSISLEFDGQTVITVADRDKISQVIVNLLSNALKYTPAGGKVAINLGDEEDCTRIDVRDTGIGIPVEDLPFIFERFYRADKSRTRTTGGTGIGLTIAKTIVEAHKGTITVESEPNKGTTFTVRLPKLTD